MDIFELILQQAEDCSVQNDDYWKQREDRMTRIYLIQYLAGHFLKSGVAIYVLFYVIFRWRRKELFLTAVPIFLLISSLLGIVSTTMRLKGTTTYADSQLTFLLLIQFFYNTGHLIFVTQYLQTSYALPYLLEDARVSLEYGELEDDHLGMGSQVQSNIVKFQGEYKDQIKSINSQMARTNYRIMAI